MANFGFDDLVVVDPYEPVWRETVSAVGAESLVLKARMVEKLEEAVGDRQLVLGTTAVKSRRLERPLVRLPNLGAFLEKHGGKGSLRIALVFGPEKTGLTEKDLEHCNAIVTIPTSSEVPSMNLSHSVAVCCYELSDIHPERAPSSGASAATAEDRERLLRQILELFDAAGYLALEPAAHKINKIRGSLLRWNLRSKDVRLLHGILRYLLKRLR